MGNSNTTNGCHELTPEQGGSLLFFEPWAEESERHAMIAVCQRKIKRGRLRVGNLCESGQRVP